MKFKKLEKIEELGRFDIWSLVGDIDDVIAKLMSYKSNPIYKNIYINTYKVYEFDSESYDIVINGTRLETDEEFEKRKELTLKEREQKRLAAIKKSKEEKDLRDYERLKAKFEKTN